MHCSKVSFQELLWFDNDIENKLENNTCNLEHNAGKLQNRIEQNRIMNLITSALVAVKLENSSNNLT